ncbi:tRNA uridine-5-carboxymethylaminomethyl(34) synthesis GTPase MnmE [Thermocrinis minervae]|uniref:tRNA modification GTPase MnmE n=1 Tax=Thermocrinis minervae TaxID=381751 RepID=A0A1M6TDP7_9AQUI|nr:tRNA uridine-5-carboxymethylaminomethyl(34) synthesis GTPase MnmE [Thermocrinis minervae]SHK55081.1 tRNA modification GTPase [Thermocrinis minervae]
MSNIKEREPIVAIATPFGESAIGVVRLSGTGLLEKVGRFIRTKSSIKPRYAHRFELVDEQGKPIDDGILIYYKAPNSYTGEDMLELFLHGNPFILKTALELFVRNGIRLAQPGEFTKRAFLNGKMDLLQAEAVADLIGAKTQLAHESALRQLKGELSSYITPLREKLLELCAYVEADIEFSEEDIPTLTREQILRTLLEVKDRIDTLLFTVKKGEYLRRGINLAIVGKPNVGKSSLFNALLGKDRAIVTSVPGTTRDFLQESLNLEGIPVNLIDTAGIRESSDEVERIGIERSLQKLREADLVLFVVDASSPLESIDLEVYNLIEETNHIPVLNKIDLGINEEVVKRFPDGIKVSAKTGQGLEELKERVLQKVGVFGADSMHVYLSVRHADLLQRAKEKIEETVELFQRMELSPEVLSLYIREALHYLEELVGTIATEDVLGSIFSRFCIGK